MFFKPNCFIDIKFIGGFLLRRSELYFLIVVMIAFVIVLGVAVLQRRGQSVYTVSISSGRILADDGGGRYIDGAEGVSITFRDSFGAIAIDLNQSTRSVYIGFEEAAWKDRYFNDIRPLLKSGNYHPILGIYAIQIVSSTETTPFRLTDTDPGSSYNDFNVIIYLGEIDGYIYVLHRGFYGRWFIAGVEKTGLAPPTQLYNKGSLIFMRVDENTWLLEGEAWFELMKISTEDNSVKEYYVKISLQITITGGG